jgi:formylglycine-generating enzyme
MRRSVMLASAFGVITALGACRAFVDLDGLGGGGGPTPGSEDASVDTASPVDGDVVIDSGPGDAGVDSNVVIDAGGDADAGLPCPGTGGPSAIRIPSPNSPNGSFCIDTTEVTNKQYNTFIATNPDAGVGQDVRCAWNTNFTPKADWPYAAGQDDKPVGSVNWCDAAAFCKWAGKRLCRKISGGPLTAAEWGNALVNEHAFACSHGGERVFPYAGAYDPAKCNGGETADVDVIENVKTRATCESGWGGVYDLSGNTHEWADGCVIGADPATDSCPLQLGSYSHGENDMACSDWTGVARNALENEVGIRCCSD